MSGHTAGPWVWTWRNGIRGTLNSAHGLILDSAAYEGMWFARYDAAEDEANARLIAAAPELLAALVALQRLAASFGVPIPDAVPAAIARATQPLTPTNED